MLTVCGDVINLLNNSKKKEQQENSKVKVRSTIKQLMTPIIYV